VLSRKQDCPRMRAEEIIIRVKRVSLPRMLNQSDYALDYLFYPNFIFGICFRVLRNIS